MACLQTGIKPLAEQMVTQFSDAYMRQPALMSYTQQWFLLST